MRARTWPFLVSLPLAWSPLGAAQAAAARTADPLPVQVSEIALSGVRGRIDHLALDAARGHLFVAALENDTLEVLDLAAGKVLASRPMGEPQGVLYLADLDLVAVTAGEPGTVEFLDGASFEARASLEVGADTDNLRYDPATKRLYVAYGRGALAVVDAQGLEVLGRIELGGHPEAFQLDPPGKRAFVNVPGRKELVLVDLERQTVLERRELGNWSANYPMTLLGASGALAIGCRTPPLLLVRATGAGTFEALELSGDVDDLYYDAGRRRIYAACGAGALDVFHLDDAGRAQLVGRVPTSDGARTCLFAPEQQRLFVACPKRGHDARVLVFKP